MPPGLRKHIPNAITGARLLLAGVFFTLLAFYQYERPGSPWLLNIAFVIYSVALFSDFLDGYLARKWKVEGAFGRIVDPFVDKILVLGSFAFFAGKNFVILDGLTVTAGTSIVEATQRLKTITGVAPAFVIIMLARELLVTALRGAAESDGHSFGAEMAGKVKMVVQSVTILIILAYVNYLDLWGRWGVEPYVRYFRDFAIWTTVVTTVLSCFGYVRRAVSMYSK